MKSLYVPFILCALSNLAFGDGLRLPENMKNLQDQVVELKPCQIGTLDPSPSSPPNNSDDPGTTDVGCWEINHTISTDRAKNPDGSRVDSTDYAWDINYGVKPGLQAKIVIHGNTLTGVDPNDPNSSASAIGRIEVGAKQQIYANDEKQLVISVFPTVDFMAPGSPAVARGLPDSGTNLTLPILISKRYGPVILVSNAGLVMSLSDSSKPAQVILSTAAGVNITDSTIITGEIYRTSDLNLQSNATTSVGIGVTTKLNEHASLYMSVGKSIGTTADGASHVYALAGVKLLFGKGSHEKLQSASKNKNIDTDLPPITLNLNN